MPAAEVTNLRSDGALLFCAIAGILGIAFVTALLRVGAFWLVAVFIAAMIVLTVILLDRGIIAAMLTRDGEELLRQRGFASVALSGFGRKAALALGRIMMSIATSSAAVTLAAVALYDNDITIHLAKTHRVENQAVRARAEQTVDGQVAAARAAHERAVAERNEVASHLSRADAPVSTGTIDGERERLVAQITAIEAEMRSTESAYYEAQRRRIAERTGVRGSQSDSGIPGEGQRHAYATELSRQLTQRYAYLARQRSEARQRLQSLASERGAYVASETERAQAARAQFEPRLAAADRRANALRNTRTALENGRAAAVTAAMEADPEFIPLRTGLIAKLEAYEELRGGSWAAWRLTFSIGVLLSVLELAVLTLRMFFAAASPAGVVRALDNRRAIDRAIAEYRRSEGEDPRTVPCGRCDTNAQEDASSEWVI